MNSKIIMDIETIKKGSVEWARGFTLQIPYNLNRLLMLFKFKLHAFILTFNKQI